jgi:hypothetical protein
MFDFKCGFLKMFAVLELNCIPLYITSKTSVSHRTHLVVQGCRTNVIKRRGLRGAMHVTFMGLMGSAYEMLVGTPEGKKALGRPRRKWDNFYRY